jgi:hypothetical protein
MEKGRNNMICIYRWHDHLWRKSNWMEKNKKLTIEKAKKKKIPETKK